MLIPLSTLIYNLREKENFLSQFLYTFSCTTDKDIEYFLHNRAVEFEKLSKSRTYLICDEDQLLTKDFAHINIYGFFSIALKTLKIPNNLSNRMRKNLDGFSGKSHGEPISDIPCYLIGQLSRNSNVSKDSINGSQLIQFACDIILKSVNHVGGRYILIECHDNPKIIQFYRNNMFEEIAHIPDHECPMTQMIRKITPYSSC